MLNKIDVLYLASPTLQTSASNKCLGSGPLFIEYNGCDVLPAMILFLTSSYTAIVLQITDEHRDFRQIKPGDQRISVEPAIHKWCETN